MRNTHLTHSRKDDWMETTDVYCNKIWEFKCPQCGEINTLDDHSFDIMEDYGESCIKVRCPICYTNMNAYRDEI